MITLKEIMDNLTYGELSHVSIGNAALGYIDPKDYPKVVSCLNGALTAVHKRFLLRTGEVRIQQQAGLATYYLRPRYATTSLEVGTKYILDSVDEPFADNVFKIERVLNANKCALTLNDSSISEDRSIYFNGSVIQDAPIFTPNFDTLVLTPAVPPEIIVVEYRADHPRIRVIDSEFNPELIELHIPYSILDAISLNIAARIYTPLTSGEGERSAASMYMYQYELECKRLENEGIALEDNTCDTRFEDNGYV